MKGKAKTFEARMQRLQEIVTALEKGDISLEESVLLYKEGKQLSTQCRGQLEKARHEITVCADEKETAFIQVKTQHTDDTSEGASF